MDFFGRQEQARRNTRSLVFLFVLAVVAIIAAVYLAVTVVVDVGDFGPRGDNGLWRPDILGLVAVGVLAVVGLGTLYKVAQLRGGGSAVAMLMGGRPVASNTEDNLERRLVNVVEEIAIASGVPVPAMFVMDHEQGINAFAAGSQPSNAAVAVTRGCLEKLDRDELQGVIAHEFSHVLNGDMRLNIRLMGVLFGITCLAMAGYVMLRGGVYSSAGRNRGGGAAAILGMGLALVIIGYLGVFFARLIKAAVSRQREYLADASAVQFTRNPKGIGGALKKIGGFAAGSRIKNAHAEEASHMFFSNGVSIWLQLFATHPPLETRIQRLEPAFRAMRAQQQADMAATGEAPAAGLAAGFAGSSTPDRLVAQVGDPQPAHVAYSGNLLGSLPLSIASAAHEPFSARCLIFGMLIGEHERRRQTEILKEHTDPATAHETHILAHALTELPLHARLPLVEVTIPALRDMSPEQFAQFERVVKLLAEADDKLSAFEFALQKLLLRHLQRHFHRTKPAPVRYRTLEPLLPYCSLVLSALAREGHDSEEAAQQAFAVGIETLGGSGVTLLPAEECGLDLLDAALDRLDRATPFIKRRVLLACARAIASDGEVRTPEAELLRAIADTLDCPMPPIAA